MTLAIAEPTAAAATEETRIVCAICNARVHSIQLHLQRDHAELGMSLADYQAAHPGHPTVSALAQRKIDEHNAAKAKTRPEESVRTEYADSVEYTTESAALHEVFSLGAVKSAMSARGTPVGITVVKSTPHASMVPDLDPRYVFNVDVLKTLIMGLELNIPVYVWGHAGCGKTTIYEQMAARTGRPMIRVQHTANMEEEHVLGGWRLRDGKTVFELGLLGQAMKHGWLYLADEYDFGRPEVLSLYQPVLEGKPLIIKEADEANRVIRPHPGFRFVATGNTNGQGDETGLYQGTSMQNAANYERFGIVEHMPYMDAALEVKLVAGQARIPEPDAEKLVDFANRIRGEFASAKISNPISPRSLIFAAKLGIARNNYIFGLQRAYINRLTSVDREAATQLAQRTFASGSTTAAARR